MDNFTWQQVCVVALGVIGVVTFFGFFTGNLRINIGGKK